MAEIGWFIFTLLMLLIKNLCSVSCYLTLRLIIPPFPVGGQTKPGSLSKYFGVWARLAVLRLAKKQLANPSNLLLNTGSKCKKTLSR